jgi:serine/threonine protein kinase
MVPTRPSSTRYSRSAPCHSTLLPQLNLNEIRYLKQCQHKNVCKYYLTLRKDTELLLLLENMEGGTLRQAAQAAFFHEKHIAYVVREILHGLSFMHAVG